MQASSTNGHLAKKSLCVSLGVRSFCLVVWRHYDVSSSCPAFGGRLSNCVRGSRLLNVLVPILLDSMVHVVGGNFAKNNNLTHQGSRKLVIIPSQWLV